MEFRVRKDAREWFRDVKRELVARQGTPAAPDFDAFYFCFIAGISVMRKKDTKTGMTAELVENFPGPYKSRGRVIVALFLRKELEYLGVELESKKSVRSEISRLVRTSAPNFLSDAGVREFNKFSHGGFEVLLDWFDDRPRALQSFLRGFRNRISELKTMS